MHALSPSLPALFRGLFSVPVRSGLRLTGPFHRVPGRSGRPAVVLALILAAFLTPLTEAANIVVNSTADPAGFNAGITIAQLGGTVTLRDAVNAANNTAGDDEITFAPALAGQTVLLTQVGFGTAIGMSAPGVSALQIASKVVIRGPSGGVTIARDSTVSILRLFWVSSTGDLTLEGLTLRDGAERTGGAVHNAGTLTVRSSTVSNCLANNLTIAPGIARGGGIYNAGTLSVTGSTFSSNAAVNSGGGIYSASGAPVTVASTVFNGCTAYVSGGAIASADGGGLSAVSGSNFVGNRVLGITGGTEANDGVGGGAIRNVGVLAVTSSTFDSNVSSNGFTGGAISNSGTLNGSGSTFVRNVVNNSNNQIFGGAINNLAQATLTNCTFTQNRAVLGSAIYVGSGDATTTLRHCTVVAQQVSNNADAAVFVRGTTSITNSIICRNYWFSTASSVNLIANVNGTFSGSNNLIDHETPEVGGLGDFGGPTQTMPLLAQSPAIDAGVPLAGVTTDQRGVARPGGAAVDIGAYEVGNSPTITSANAVTFFANTTNAFQVIGSGVPSPIFSVIGTLPPGVTLTSAGLLSGVPPGNAAGTYPLTLRAENSLGQFSTQSFVLTVSQSQLLVTTTVDEDNGDTNPALGTGTSLREAFNRATQLGGAQTICFSTALAGQTVQATTGVNFGDGPSAFRCNTSITVQGLTGPNGITLARGVASDLRAFQVGTNGTLTINDLTLANWSSGSGGAVLSYGALRMNRCTVRDCFSGDAAVFVPPGNSILENCTLVGNSGGYAIRSNGIHTMRHVTITGNTGGGMAHPNPCIAINCIIAGNTVNGNPVDVVGRLSSASVNNLIGTGGSGNLVNGVNGNIVGVPIAQVLLGPLASNGGPTQTLALLPGSPAIDGASDLRVTDQRGFTRPQGTAPDIGAFEAVPPVVVTTTVDENNGTSDPSFGTGTSLREALAYAQSLGGAPTIAFAPALYGQTVTLTQGATGAGDDTALRNGSDLTIDGGAGVTINLASSVPRRHFLHSGGLLNLRNLTFSGGDIRTVNDGGALYNTATVNVTNVRFTNNRANHGGAVMNFGTMTIASSTFDNNATAANGQGGAIWSNSTLGVTGTTFHLNSAGVLGGAIASFNGLTASSCNFSTNHSGFNGGAVRLDGTAAISGSTFSNNTATNGGGAIMSHGATTLTNVTVAYNTALDGGGIQFFDGAPSVRHATIAYNTATRFGGGIEVNLADVTLRNTLVAGNAEAINLASFNAASSNNLLNLTATQAGLGAFANHGGSLATLALLPGSPAINSGMTIAGLTTDQRGLARSVGGAPDIGALEDATGDDDPDRDSLTNFAEFQLTTNPLALDTDGDGFNDATESMNGSNPTLGTSLPGATRIERVLGLGPARGLDLTGTFLYAVNVGTNGAPGQIGDANFTADDVAGVTITAALEIPTWTVRDFGSTAEEDRLEEVYRSIRWDGPSPGVKVDAANLVPGRNYKLQLLFADGAGYTRAFDVTVNGTNIVPLYNTNLAQGANLKPYAASAIVHTFTAASSALNVTLSNTGTGAFDPNPILNGFTLEEIPTAASAPLITPASGTYTGSVTVSIATPAPGATIRYTLDGSAPSETVGAIYNGAFELSTSATVRAIAFGGGWLPSPLTSASYTVQTTADAWRALHSLPADGSQDFANPSRDGVPNLLKYAFNLAPNPGDLLNPNVSVLASNGTAGLPALGRDAQGRLVIEFIRRKAATQPAITYLVETGTDLNNLQPLDLSGATVVSIDANWERVTVTDPTITPERFGRVRITR